MENEMDKEQEHNRMIAVKSEELKGGEQIFNSHGFLIGTFTGFETPFGLEVKNNGGFIDVPLLEAWWMPKPTPPQTIKSK